MLEIALYIFLGLLASLLVTRLTEKPIRIPLPTLAESGANTFTTSPVSVPAVPTIALVRGDAKGIGLEIMKIMTEMPIPDIEDDQLNRFTYQLFKGGVPAAQQSPDDSRSIYRRRINVDSDFTTSGNASNINEATLIEDLTDGDGNGELVLDGTLHQTVEGTGNATAKTMVGGYLLAHLVEFDRNEAVFELLEQAGN